MAVRQYIGARYVPRFVGTYSPTQSYDALDVVDNGQGTSYIARIPTPANTPLTDSTHWFLYGSSSGAIVNLQQQIDDMKDGTISGSLQNQINGNDADIMAVSKKMERNAIYIGNSFTAGDGSASGRNGIFARTKDRLFDHAYMYTDGARALVNYQSFNTNFLTLLQGAIASGDFQNSDITDIIFIGAYGDVRAYDSGVTESDFLAQCMAIRNLIDSTFPNIKKVSYANAHAQYSFNAQGYLASSSSPFRLHKMLSRVLDKSSIDYLGWIGWDLMYNTSVFSPDNIHPDDNGYAWLAGAFINAYQGGDIVYTPYIRDTSIEFNGHVCESKYILSPDQLIVDIGRIDRRVNGVATPITLTQGTNYVFNLADPIMYFNPIFSRSGELTIKIGDITGSEGVADITFTDPTTFPKLGFNWKSATATFNYDLYCYGLQVVAPW